jgi:hypothetical protein
MYNSRLQANLRDRTKANVERKESVLLVASHSILVLMHIAPAAIYNRRV